MKKVLLLEDNMKILEAITVAVKELNKDLIVYSLNNVDEAYKIAFSQNIDLFVLDIILTTKYPGDISGFTFARKLRKHISYMFTPIIFITSLEDQKLYAYSEIHSYAYLEKPFSIDKFKELIINTLQFPGKQYDEKEIYMRKEGILYQIKLEKVIYVECKMHKLFIYMTNGELEIPYYTIKKFIEDSNTTQFIQCNRHTIVNREFIEYVDIANRFISVYSGNKKNILLEIGIRYKKTFLEQIHRV